MSFPTPESGFINIRTAFKILFIILALLTVLITVLYFIKPDILGDYPDMLLQRIGLTEDKDTASVFEKQIGKPQDLNLLVYKELEKFEKQAPESYSSWNMRKDMFLARVVSVDKKKKQMVINISIPTGRSFSGKDMSVKIDCESEDSAALAPYSLAHLKSNIEVTAEAVEQDSIYSYCLNEKCSEIGRKCVLVKNLP